MDFGFCGINYKSAGLDIRDIVNFTDSRKMEMFHRLEKEGILQCMILSTCNRSEVYYFYENPRHPEIIRAVYQEMFLQVDLKPYFNHMEREAAIKYLFRVTAGMESQILGEDQILGQVKEAFEFSKAMGYSRKELNGVVRNAVACAKKIKTELKISEFPLSVSYAGIRQLEREYGISGKRVLIIGSGQTAALALRYVRDYGAEKIIVCNRTSSHAKALKAEFPEIDIKDFENRYEVMKECEIVISATASPHLVIRKEKCIIRKEMYFLDLYTRNIHRGDSKVVTRTELMRSVAPMTGYAGEKNFNPVYMLLQVADSYPFIAVNECLCIVDYQLGADSMSENIYRQYVDSPRSFAKLRRLEMTLRRSTWNNNLRCAVHYVSNCILAGDKDWLGSSPRKVLTILAAIPGWMLSRYIRHKVRQL